MGKLVGAFEGGGREGDSQSNIQKFLWAISFSSMVVSFSGPMRSYPVMRTIFVQWQARSFGTNRQTDFLLL